MVSVQRQVGGGGRSKVRLARKMDCDSVMNYLVVANYASSSFYGRPNCRKIIWDTELYSFAAVTRVEGMGNSSTL